MRHPVVFFEILAFNQDQISDFYEQVFGWSYTATSSTPGGFRYVEPPFERVEVRGGIGTARPPLGSRVNFYVQVDDLEEALTRVTKHGGATLTPPTQVDGYHFAIFSDPECNAVGIVTPFPPEQTPEQPPGK